MLFRVHLMQPNSLLGEHVVQTSIVILYRSWAMLVADDSDAFLHLSRETVGMGLGCLAGLKRPMGT